MTGQHTRGCIAGEIDPDCPCETYRQPDVLPPAVSSPCNECPWRRSSAPGHLGPYSAQQWVRIAHGESAIACHKTIVISGEWEGARQCAGAAAFRANVCKSPRNPTVASGPGREDVFQTNSEFVEHHTGGTQTWAMADMYGED